MWKPFNDKYLVSSNGEIKNIKTLKDKVLFTSELGYKRVNISNKNYFVHRLVALLFLDNPDNLPIVHHKDGNRANNSVSNLEWTTQKNNIQQSYKDKGISGNCKLTIDQVRHIISSSKNKEYTAKELAKMYKVSEITIYVIRSGKNIKRLLL